MSLLTQEEHKAFVEELGFKKVGGRCPVCYVEQHIEKKLKEAIESELVECQEEITSKHSSEQERNTWMVCHTVLDGLLKKLDLEEEE